MYSSAFTHLKYTFCKLSAIVFLILTLMLFCSCSPFSHEEISSPSDTEQNQSKSAAVSADSTRLDAYLDTLFRQEVVTDTISMHYTIAMPENYGIDEYPVTLGVISKESYEASMSSLENMQAVLAQYDTTKLSSTHQMTIDVLNSYIATQLCFHDYYLYDEILRPSTGIQSQLPVLLAEYKFRTKQDVLDYLGLLADIERYFDEIVDYEIARSNEGLFMADFAVDTIIRDCSTFCAAANDKEHYLITTFRSKIEEMDSLTDKEKEQYLQKNETLIRERVLPSYIGLSEALSALKGTGVNDKGLCYLKNGKTYYTNLVHSYTGSSHTVEELDAMTQKRRELDLTAISSLTAENPDLQRNAASFTIDTSNPEQVLKHLITQISEDFPAPVDSTFQINYVDECMQEAMAPAFYLTAPIDDLSQNSIYINPSSGSSGLSLFTTLAHEGFPGHLYQTTMSYDAGLTPIRSLISCAGYTEGWATYVEMLSYGYSGLSEDAASLLSLNQSAILSLYASADMGIHYNGWSLSDTIKFFRDYGISDAETIRSIYEYIVAEPAHYLKYYIGFLEFLNLRDYAMDLYGDKYTAMNFHNAVLTMGSAPFDLLKKYLPEYYPDS